MKNVCIIFLLSIIISLTAITFGKNSSFSQNDGGRYEMNLENEYLRIHIRADDNSSSAQSVKYFVRDKVVQYLTPLVANYTTQQQAIDGVCAHLPKIEQIATNALYQKGFSYGATAKLTVESFPTRVYDGYVLPAGEYAALILCLGRGTGDNWWCVVYPPLCFSAPTGSNVIYKSKIKEIIDNFIK